MHVILEKIMTLDDGDHEFAFESSNNDLHLDIRDFEGNCVFPNTIHTIINLKKTGHTYYMVIKTKTVTHFMCDRCLASIDFPIEGTSSVVYSNLHNHHHQQQDDDFRTINLRQTNAVNLDKDVRDILILSIPNKILCRPDCRGLCVQCGTDLNERSCEHVKAHDPVMV